MMELSGYFAPHSGLMHWNHARYAIVLIHDGIGIGVFKERFETEGHLDTPTERARPRAQRCTQSLRLMEFPSHQPVLTCCARGRARSALQSGVVAVSGCIRGDRRDVRSGIQRQFYRKL